MVECKGISCFITRIIQNFWAGIESGKTSCIFRNLQTTGSPVPYIIGTCRSNDKYQKRKDCMDISMPFLNSQCQNQCKKFNMGMQDVVCKGSDVMCRCKPQLK